MSTCPNCGSSVEIEDVFCEQCGYKLDTKVRTNKPEKASNESLQPKKKVRFVRANK